MKQYEQWIVMTDFQTPYHDTASLRAVEAYMADEKWDGYINLGDFLDFNELSSWNEDAPRRVIEKTAQTFKIGNEILDRHQKLIRAKNKDAIMVLLEGNHEYRTEVYMDKHPELEGTLEVEIGLRLKERKITWVPYWSTGKLFKKGNAYFAHGKFTNKNHAFNTVDRYGVCIYYGHTHDVQEFPKVVYGKDKTLVGKSLGCLCRYDQRYLKGNPTNWQQAFAVFRFFPDGYYTENTIRIFKNRFVGLNGKVYDGKKTNL